MADTIVGGLFGIDPYQRQQEQAKLLNTQAQQFAELDPFQRANYALYSGGAKLGNLGAGLMGAQDPQLVAQQTAQQLASQFDISSPQGLKDYSAALLKAGQESGNPSLSNFGMMALDKARQAELSTINIEEKRTELQKTKSTTEQLANYRKEIESLPKNAKDEDYLAIAKKYSQPTDVFKILEIKAIKEAALAAKITAGSTTKPLPVSLQKEETKDLETIERYTSQSEALVPSIANLTADEKGFRKLELGPLKNAAYMARNLAGNSNPESRAFEALQSAVKTAVNLQTSAEKGVQTDKDVLRFADALIAAYGKNDTEATLQALKRYNEAIEKAKINTVARLQSRRKEQKIEPYDFGTQQQTQNPQQTNIKIKQYNPSTGKVE